MRECGHQGSGEDQDNVRWLILVQMPFHILSHPILFVAYSHTLSLSRALTDFSHSRLAYLVVGFYSECIPELGNSWYIFVCTPTLLKVLIILKQSSF